MVRITVGHTFHTPCKYKPKYNSRSQHFGTPRQWLYEIRNTTFPLHTAFHWATWHLPIAHNHATCRHITRPQSTNQKISTSPATLTVRSPRQLYGICHVSCTACPVNTLFFPVWRFEQIAITFAPDVRLRRNELRWVRDVEGYKPICFEVILRTLIFELKFAP
jgi:hypothetical protein